MAEMLHPGVYIQEVSSGNQPILGVGTSVAGFIGAAARGIPGTAHFLTSFADYVTALGGPQPGDAGNLASAVQAFFNAGGVQAYAVRVLPSDAIRGGATDANNLAPVTVINTRVGGASAPGSIAFIARGAGAWSDSIRINITDSSNFPDSAFNIDVYSAEAGAVSLVESWHDVTMDPEQDSYAVQQINDNSKYLNAYDEFALAVANAKATDLPLIAAVPATLQANPATSGKYTIYDGMTFVITEADASSTNAPDPVTVVFSQTNVTAAGVSTTWTNGAVTLTTAQFRTVLANITATAKSGTTGKLNTFFNISTTADPPTIIASVATPASLTIASAANYSLAATINLTYGPSGNPTKVAVPLITAADPTKAPADVTKVIPDDLVASLKAALLSTPSVTVVKNASGSITITAPAFDTDNTIALDFPTAGVTVTAGTGGTTPDHYDGLTLAIAEKLQPNIPPGLRGIGFPARARGYSADSPANPVVRPVDTTGYRLLGGYDGKNPIGAADFEGDATARTGLHAFDGVAINMLALPGQSDPSYISIGMGYADARGDLFYIVDGPGSTDKQFSVLADDAKQFIQGLPTVSKNAAMFYPWVRVTDPTGVGKNPTRFVAPSGHMAGVFARTDINRGVWKAPAGVDATITDALGLQANLVDADQDILNPVNLNCLRQFPGAGIVSWGSRTLSPDPEWRYVPVRRTALFLEQSLLQGLRWAVFEPNDDQLWDRIRTNIQAFMLSLFRQGAFQGTSPDQAFLVKCDRSTNPQELVDEGIVTAQVSFAPLKPAEFVVIQVSQKSLVS